MANRQVTGLPTQKYWDLVLKMYCVDEELEECIPDLPKDVATFLSAKVPWEYQYATAPAETNNAENGLQMVRTWVALGRRSQGNMNNMKKNMKNMNGLFEEPESATVAGVREITGKYYNDGTMIVWDPSTPPEKAQLQNARGTKIAIDDAHLDVVLFRVPRTVDGLTVSGTVRRVLHSIYSAGSDLENYQGFARTFADSIQKSLKYVAVEDAHAVIMSFERAKWQAKIKDIIGVQGGMDEMAIGDGFNFVRPSAYKDKLSNNEIATIKSAKAAANARTAANAKKSLAPASGFSRELSTPMLAPDRAKPRLGFEGSPRQALERAKARKEQSRRRFLFF